MRRLDLKLNCAHSQFKNDQKNETEHDCGIALRSRFPTCPLLNAVYFPCSSYLVISSQQNLLFYYESEHSVRPIGAIFLEGCYCERLLNPPTGAKDDMAEKIVSNIERQVINVY